MAPPSGPRRRAYLDYNATAPLRPEVRRAIEPLLDGAIDEGAFGNPSSIHWAGQSARRKLEDARGMIARLLDRRPSEIIFTSGGSESDNLALLGVVLHPRARSRRLIISRVEHPAVLEAARRLEEMGATVVQVPVGEDGELDLALLSKALEEPAALVSVMAVNNETGVLSPLGEIISMAHEKGTLVHVDAVQAIGRVPIPKDADLLSLSAHKLGALKGTGVLVSKQHVPLRSTMLGGPQERGHRAGTESVVGAAALAVALERALTSEEMERERLGALTRRIEAIVDEIPGTRILGRRSPRASNTTTVLFEGVEGDSLLQALDLEGIAASTGSACSSGSLEPSHVLLAMGVPKDRALGAVRFSLGWATKSEDIDLLAEVLPGVTRRVRGFEPLGKSSYSESTPDE